MPTLASTIYGVSCTGDADCALAPTGDVCDCAGWGAVTAEDVGAFMQRRELLGHRCPSGQAAACTADPGLWEARCQAEQCIATRPRSLACVDAQVPTPLPSTVQLMATSPEHTAALSQCPFALPVPHGPTQVWLLRPKTAGKYRIALRGPTDASVPAARWLFVRTPDCNADNVACRWCAPGAERCIVDEVLAADETAVIVVRNCDDSCSLAFGQWDPQRPWEPPMSG